MRFLLLLLPILGCASTPAPDVVGEWTRSEKQANGGTDEESVICAEVTEFLTFADDGTYSWEIDFEYNDGFGCEDAESVQVVEAGLWDLFEYGGDPLWTLGLRVTEFTLQSGEGEPVPTDTVTEKQWRATTDEDEKGRFLALFAYRTFREAE